MSSTRERRNFRLTTVLEKKIDAVLIDFDIPKRTFVMAIFSCVYNGFFQKKSPSFNKDYIFSFEDLLSNNPKSSTVLDLKIKKNLFEELFLIEKNLLKLDRELFSKQSNIFEFLLFLFFKEYDEKSDLYKSNFEPFLLLVSKVI